MKHVFIAFLLCFAFGTTESQNLIANGSFENYSNITCSTGFYTGFYPNEIPLIDNWDAVQSPDYFTSVCTSTYISSPVNILGYCQPKSGIAYAGFIAFYIQSEYKEYPYQHLNNPLIAGQIYCLNFYVSRVDRCQYAVKNIGAYFCNVMPSGQNLQNPSSYFNFLPQVENQTESLSDTTQWTQIQGCFTANGGEEYIIIGNFNSNIDTDTSYVGTNNQDPLYANPLYDYSYYYIDDVSLYEQTSVDVHYLDDDKLYIFPNPTKDLLKIDVGRLKNNKESYTIKIIDIFGKEILHEVLEEEINVCKLDQGIYSLQLYEDGKLIGTKKILKD